MNLDFAIRVLLVQLQNVHDAWSAAVRESHWGENKTATHDALALAVEQNERDMKSLTDAIAILMEQIKR